MNETASLGMAIENSHKYVFLHGNNVSMLVFL